MSKNLIDISGYCFPLLASKTSCPVLLNISRTVSPGVLMFFKSCVVKRPFLPLPPSSNDKIVFSAQSTNAKAIFALLLAIEHH